MVIPPFFSETKTWNPDFNVSKFALYDFGIGKSGLSYL